MKRLFLAAVLLALAAASSFAVTPPLLGNCAFLEAQCQLRCRTPSQVQFFQCNPYRCVCD